MDSFNFDNVKAEKVKAMRRYSRLRNFANVARVLEVCVALVLLSWSSTRLPVAAKISGEYLRQLSNLLLSTPSIFVIGNVIVITLVAKSGSQNSNTGDNIYDEYVKNTEIVTEIDSPAPVEIATEDKQIVISENAIPPVKDVTVNTVTTVTTVPDEKAPETKKNYRRTQSENFKRESDCVKSWKELRRSETEKCRRSPKSGGEPERLSYAVDRLSNEEFQRTIEAFIQKQQRFLREEYMGIVPSSEN